MDEKSIEEEIKTKAQQAKKLARYMSSTEDLVENQIRKAMEKGEFDNLEGAGKPIPLEENPYEPVGMRMVNKILKDNDFAPYWIELGKQIDHEWEKIQRDIENFKKYSTMVLGEKRTKAAIDRFESKKNYFYYEKEMEIEKISKKILDYNLHCPTFRLGRANIIIEEEINKIKQEIETYIQKLMQSL